jgi:hypothetical protein
MFWSLFSISFSIRKCDLAINLHIKREMGLLVRRGTALKIKAENEE